MISELSADVVNGIISFLNNILMSLNLDYLLYIFGGITLFFILVSGIRLIWCYEDRTVRAIKSVNKYLKDHPKINDDNLVDFHKKMKKLPRRIRDRWQLFMLERDGSPSRYLTVEYCVKRPLYNSAILMNQKQMIYATVILAVLGFVFSLACITVEGVITDLSVVLLQSFMVPSVIIVLGSLYCLVLHLRYNRINHDFYDLFTNFVRNIDKATNTMPDYVDYELLFTQKEIEKGIPVLREYLEKRALEEQRLLEKAKREEANHSPYDFSSLGVDGAQLIERAVTESEKFLIDKINIQNEITDLEKQLQKTDANKEDIEREANKKLQAIKENLERLDKAMSETTNRVELNYNRRQSEAELSKKLMLEKDLQTMLEKEKVAADALRVEIEKRKETIDTNKKEVENALKSEYDTFATKVYDELNEKVIRDSSDTLHEMEMTIARLKAKVKEFTSDLEKKESIIEARNLEIDNMRQQLSKQRGKSKSKKEIGQDFIKVQENNPDGNINSLQVDGLDDVDNNGVDNTDIDGQNNSGENADDGAILTRPSEDMENLETLENEEYSQYNQDMSQQNNFDNSMQNPQNYDDFQEYNQYNEYPQNQGIAPVEYPEEVANTQDELYYEDNNAQSYNYQDGDYPEQFDYPEYTDNYNENFYQDNPQYQDAQQPYDVNGQIENNMVNDYQDNTQYDNNYYDPQDAFANEEFSEYPQNDGANVDISQNNEQYAENIENPSETPAENENVEQKADVDIAVEEPAENSDVVVSTLEDEESTSDNKDSAQDNDDINPYDEDGVLNIKNFEKQTKKQPKVTKNVTKESKTQQEKEEILEEVAEVASKTNDDKKEPKEDVLEEVSQDLDEVKEEKTKSTTKSTKTKKSTKEKVEEEDEKSNKVSNKQEEPKEEKEEILEEKTEKVVETKPKKPKNAKKETEEKSDTDKDNLEEEEIAKDASKEENNDSINDVEENEEKQEPKKKKYADNDDLVALQKQIEEENARLKKQQEELRAQIDNTLATMEKANNASKAERTRNIKKIKDLISKLKVEAVKAKERGASKAELNKLNKSAAELLKVIADYQSKK